MSSLGKRGPGKGLRTVVAAALAVGLVGLAAPLALADPDVTIPDASRQGSLTIHKYEQPGTATDLPANGTKIPDADLAGLTPLPGVTFTVQRVNGADLTSYQGWLDVRDLALDFNRTANVVAALALLNTPPFSLAAGVSDVTAADGTITFTGLPVGLYLVTETAGPAGVVPARPFLVTIPITEHTTNGVTDKWLYDVHVYPKNQKNEPVKSVNDADAVQVGNNTVTWTVDAPIVKPTTGTGVYEAFIIKDTLDPRLRYNTSTVEIVNAFDPTDTVALVPADYNIVAPAAGDTTYRVVFTTAGLVKVNAAADAGGFLVRWVLDTTVIAPIGDGIIPNEAVVYDNSSETGGKTTNKPVTKWGGIELVKTGAHENLLAGAKFIVVAHLGENTSGGTLDYTDAVNIGGEVWNQIGDVAVPGGATVWTTDENGRLSITGLRYSCFANGQDLPNCPSPANPNQAVGTASIQYYLVEVQAPPGYSLLAEPIQFLVTGLTSGDPIHVINVEDNGGFLLPLTGGTGTALFIGVGVVLLGACAGLVVVSRRRSAAATR